MLSKSIDHPMAEKSDPIAIKSYISPEEYLAFSGLCADLGVSHSARIRMLIKEDIRAQALKVKEIHDFQDTDIRGAFARSDLGLERD